MTVSAAVLLLSLVVLLVRKGGLKIGHALLCLLAGFYLSSSALAPSIRDATISIIGLIGDLHL